jgi:putative membrane protein
LLLWLPAIIWARRNAAHYGYALGERLVAVRAGAWSRHWRFAERATLQVVALHRNPLDRRLGTASLWFDTAGSSASAPEFAVRYLPLAEARAMLDALHHDIARRPLRW